MEIASQVYGITTTFPKNETNGSASQMNRAAVSIPSNIAEGHFNHYLQCSLGSSYELQNQLIVAYRNNYICQKITQNIEENLIKLQRMISCYITSPANERR